MADDGTVTLHGRTYKTVALRVQQFRETHTIEDGWSITTAIIEDTADRVLMRAAIVAPDGVEVATGHADEIRGSSHINKRAALENCETGAIGRALAAAGFGGSEYASADELASKIIQPEPRSRKPAAKPATTAKPTATAKPAANPAAKQERKHDPSFEGNHAKWFFARLGEAGINYERIAAELENRGYGRPSEWSKNARMHLLDEISAGKWRHLQAPRKR